jgi:hypothetical protein
VSIAVTPVNASVSPTSYQQFTAIGTYQDGTTFDITNLVMWTSSDLTVAVFNYWDPEGLAETLAEGPTMIFATDPATGIVSPPVTLMVTATAGVLISISTTANSSFEQGTQLQLYAGGTYADGTTQDITTSVTWLSSSPTIASISNTSPSNGLVTGLALGTASIAATSEGIASAPPTLVAVTPVGLTSIVVTPTNLTRSLGYVQPFTATGSYRNGATFDLTNFVTWNSSNSAVAYMLVGLSGATNGVAYCDAIGQTSIVAIDPGSGVNSPATTLTVTH